VWRSSWKLPHHLFSFPPPPSTSSPHRHSVEPMANTHFGSSQASWHRHRDLNRNRRFVTHPPNATPLCQQVHTGMPLPSLRDVGSHAPCHVISMMGISTAGCRQGLGVLDGRIDGGACISTGAMRIDRRQAYWRRSKRRAMCIDRRWAYWRRGKHIDSRWAYWRQGRCIDRRRAYWRRAYWRRGMRIDRRRAYWRRGKHRAMCIDRGRAYWRRGKRRAMCIDRRRAYWRWGKRIDSRWAYWQWGRRIDGGECILTVGIIIQHGTKGCEAAFHPHATSLAPFPQQGCTSISKLKYQVVNCVQITGCNQLVTGYNRDRL